MGTEKRRNAQFTLSPTEILKNPGLYLGLGSSVGRKLRHELEPDPASEQPARHEKRDRELRAVMERTGWSFDYTKKQYRICRKRTGCNATEYRLYRMYELDEKEQADVFLIADRNRIRARYDDPAMNRLFDDKILSNRFFSDYIRRRWCPNRHISQKKFETLFSSVSRLLYKPIYGERGFGIELFDLTEESLSDVFQKVKSLPDGVIEEYITQHPDMDLLMPGCVNTVRVVSVSSTKTPVLETGEKADIAYASVRIGSAGSFVDNFHSGGLAANIDLRSGQIITDAVDGAGNVYPAHPVTGTVFRGFTIPCFPDTLALVRTVIEKKKISGYLGWDIAVTPAGPELIEVNPDPGLSSLSAPYAAEHRGMKPLMMKYLRDTESHPVKGASPADG